jgi:hypothetical protein
MASVAHYGPCTPAGYAAVAPGEESSWSFKLEWYGKVVTVMAHPIADAPGTHQVLVTDVTSLVNSGSDDRYITCTVRNVGPDDARYSVWLGVIDH